MSEAAAPASGGTSSAFQAAINSGGGESSNSGPPTSVREAINRERSPQDEGFDVAEHRDASPPRRQEPKDPAKAEPKRQEREPQQRQQREERPDDDFARTYRVKVNGQEKDVSLSEMRDYYQRGESANKRFQEAADLRKQAEAANEKAARLLKDPKALVESLLDDPDGARTVHEAYQEMLRLAKLSPEQQQEYLRVKELERRDGQLRQMEEQRQAKEAEAREARIVDQHLDGMEDAFDMLGWKPSEKMQDVTDMMTANLIDEMREQGIKATYKQVAETIKGAVMDMIGDHVSALDDAGLRELIGEKRLRKMMNAEVSQLQSRLPQRTNPETAPARQPNGRFKEPESYVHHAGDMRGFRSLVEGR